MAASYSTFKRLVRKYLTLLGLGEWRVDFLHESLKDTTILAQVRIDLNQKTAKFVLNKGAKPTGELGWDLDDSAFHEVMHIAFYEMLWVAATSRNANSPKVEALEHALINRLGAVLRGRGR
jgi:hypothetical protein